MQKSSVELPLTIPLDEPSSTWRPGRSRSPRNFDNGHEHHNACHTIPRSMATMPKSCTCSETATTATTLPSCRVGRRGCDILDTADAHTGTGKGTKGGLSAGTGGLGAVSTSGSDLNVQGRNAKFLAAGSYFPYQIPLLFTITEYIITYRRPELPTWQRMGKTHHGRP